MPHRGINKEIELARITGASVDHLNPEDLAMCGETLDEAGDNLYPVICAVAIGYNPTRYAREQGIPRPKAAHLFDLARQYILANLE